VDAHPPGGKAHKAVENPSCHWKEGRNKRHCAYIVARVWRRSFARRISIGWRVQISWGVSEWCAVGGHHVGGQPPTPAPARPTHPMHMHPRHASRSPGRLDERHGAAPPPQLPIILRREKRITPDPSQGWALPAGRRCHVEAPHRPPIVLQRACQRSSSLKHVPVRSTRFPNSPSFRQQKETPFFHKSSPASRVEVAKTRYACGLWTPSGG
jgi:hypothetical protein